MFPQCSMLRLLVGIFAIGLFASSSSAFAVTYPVTNNTSEYIGPVLISLDDSTFETVDVTDSGTFNGDIGSASVVNVLIDGTTVAVGTTVDVTLASLTIVTVKVTASAVEILDWDEEL